MPIETLEDIVEWMADLAGVNGICKDGCDHKCDCRIGFTLALSYRIKHSYINLGKMDFPLKVASSIIDSWYEQGIEAAKLYKPLAACPYVFDTTPVQLLWWNRGWNDESNRIKLANMIAKIDRIIEFAKDRGLL